jgi:hypothetical protein
MRTGRLTGIAAPAAEKLMAPVKTSPPKEMLKSCHDNRDAA